MKTSEPVFLFLVYFQNYLPIVDNINTCYLNSFSLYILKKEFSFLVWHFPFLINVL